MGRSMKDLQKITSLCKRRGFVFPSSEIYGGLANTYDFGPLGVMLKNNLKKLWWARFMQREDIYPIDSSVIINPKVWEASGHVDSFADVMVEDLETHKRYRADHLIEEHFEAKGENVKVDGKSVEELQSILEKEDIKSPEGNTLSKARQFSTLFETEIGIISGDKNKAYLRGEIAQGLFINYKNIIDAFHPKLPFGIGQVGKAFRNEITPGQFTFRTLEFDLMEFEYFFDPADANWEKLFDTWKDDVYAYAEEVGLQKENLKWRPHEDFELSHYSSRTEDLEYKFPWGSREMFAVAYRTDFDLKNHQEKSGVNMEYIYPDGKRVMPHVIEPTFGLSRLATIVLMDAYEEEEDRIILKLHKDVSPYRVAVFPLLKNKPELVEKAQKIYDDLVAAGISTAWDDRGNIGKRYYSQDEIGTPYCVTVDFQTLEDDTVTLRDRDSMEQERVSADDIYTSVK
jgi:glycyl-tRNA synthetase